MSRVNDFPLHSSLKQQVEHPVMIDKALRHFVLSKTEPKQFGFIIFGYASCRQVIYEPIRR